MMNVLIDTSIFIEFSRTTGGQLMELMSLKKKREVNLITSSVVMAEFWAGQSMQVAKNQMSAKVLFCQTEVIDCDQNIAKIAGQIKREQDVLMIDALIAATAIDQRAQIATLNPKHFQLIPGITLWRPTGL